MIPDHAALEILPISFVFQYFHPDSSVCSILQFLDNFLHSILDEDGPSSPICYTNVFSHAELALPIDWLPIIVIFEVQAHAVTLIIRILNFFVPNFGSPCCTHSDTILSELNFPLVI